MQSTILRLVVLEYSRVDCHQIWQSQTAGQRCASLVDSLWVMCMHIIFNYMASIARVMHI